MVLCKLPPKFELDIFFFHQSINYSETTTPQKNIKSGFERSMWVDNAISRPILTYFTRWLICTNSQQQMPHLGARFPAHLYSHTVPWVPGLCWLVGECKQLWLYVNSLGSQNSRHRSIWNSRSGEQKDLIEFRFLSSHHRRPHLCFSLWALSFCPSDAQRTP